MTSLVVRRHAGGRRRSDVPVAVAASPWHLLSAALGTVVALLLPAVVARRHDVLGGVGGGRTHRRRPAPRHLRARWRPARSWASSPPGGDPGEPPCGGGRAAWSVAASAGRSASEILVTALLLAGAGLGVWAWLRGRHARLVAVDGGPAAVRLAAPPLRTFATFRALRRRGLPWPDGHERPPGRHRRRRRGAVEPGRRPVRSEPTLRSRFGSGRRTTPSVLRRGPSRRWWTSSPTRSGGRGPWCGARSSRLRRCHWWSRCGTRRTASPTSWS